MEKEEIHREIKPSNQCFSLFLLFFVFFAAMVFGLRDCILSHSTSPLFVIYFFEIGSHELFAWAGFKL
jgi:hypothetical protein